MRALDGASAEIPQRETVKSAVAGSRRLSERRCARSPDAPAADGGLLHLHAALGADPHLHQCRRADHAERHIYPANSVLVDGLNYKCAIGLDVDQQQITIAARPTDTVGGVPFLQALRNGVFDGARSSATRLSDRLDAPPIGSVVLFKGRVGDDRQARPYQGGDHRQFRPGPARHRHAAQSLCADLPACAL